MTDREVLKLALEALETELCIDWTNNDEFNASAEKMHEAITAIHEALAQPAQRPWVGLTDTEIKAIKYYISEHGKGNQACPYERKIKVHFARAPVGSASTGEGRMPAARMGSWGERPGSTGSGALLIKRRM